MKHRHAFHWVRYTSRHITKEGYELYEKLFNEIDWESVLPMDHCQRARVFHENIQQLNDRCFPIRQHKYRSTDDPWIDDQVRKKIEQRKSAFETEEGRGPNWKELKEESVKMIRVRKKKYYEKECEKLSAPGANRISYKALRNISDAERQPQWNIRQLRPESTDEEILEELADYFAAISQAFPPLDRSKIPITYDRPVVLVDEVTVAQRMMDLKRPSSSVSIDPLPKTVNKHIAQLAKIMTPVINAVLKGGIWPEVWSEEEVSIIPKTHNPDSFDACRNVSCTSLFSKLCESFVLDRMQEEVSLAETQFGGVKGTGTVHLLAELVTETMECLDDNRAAVSMVSVDMSKAFNRVKHDLCLSALAKHGASNETLKMAASFLENRRMKIKLPGSATAFSTSRRTPGGAPQGTKCGNFLYCVAARELKEEGTIGTEEPQSALGLTELNRRIMAQEDTPPSSPLGGYDRDVRQRPKACWYDSSDTEDEWTSVHRLASLHCPPPRWKNRPLKEVEFVDDMTAAEKVDITGGISTLSERKEKRKIWSRQGQSFFDKVKDNSIRCGMVVNDRKTQILCVTAAINYDVRSFLNISGEMTTSTDTLTVVGFTFGRRPGAEEHVKKLRKMYGARAWTIRHLKKVGMDQKLLVRIYCELVRPIFEYECPAFHTILTDDQSERLEKMQRATLKTIFGMDVTYETCLQRAGIETLKSRREELFKKFTIKAYESEKYKKRWFTEKKKSRYDLRHEDLVEQEFANCQRLQRAPFIECAP